MDDDKATEKEGVKLPGAEHPDPNLGKEIVSAFDEYGESGSFANTASLLASLANSVLQHFCRS